MKKLFYLLCFAAFSALTITSCTEEEIKPSQEAGSNGGANGTGDVLR